MDIIIIQNLKRIINFLKQKLIKLIGLINKKLQNLI